MSDDWPEEQLQLIREWQCPEQTDHVPARVKAVRCTLEAGHAGAHRIDGIDGRPTYMWTHDELYCARYRREREAQ